MESHNTITLTGFKKAADPSVEVTIPRELGPVRLLHEIGRGGMGVVYLGRHRMLDRDVAVKFLLHAVAGPDDPGFAGFLEGTRAAARVDHPGLTTIHHADVVDGIPYLVMQYIDGPTLGEVLKKTGPLSLSALFAVLDAVSEAIGELHDREIVHRDIKPANILLDREGHVFVTDFGLACSRPRAKRGQESTGLAGTPTYMAPEMFDGAVSLRSDVYALGITSFELLAGKLPFGGTLDEVREKHVHQALPVELLQEQDCVADFIEVLERATHKDAMYRYKTARHFQTALKSSVATEEVLHKGASELQRVVARSLHKDSDATTPETADKSPTSTYFARLSEIAGKKRATREPSDKGDAHPPESPLDKGGLGRVGAEAPPLPPGDQAAEAGSIPGERPTRAATLVADVPCVQCGYNLRGLPPDRRCPECGEGLASSLRPDRLLFADRVWLTHVARGLTVIYATMTAMPVVAVFISGLGAFFSSGSPFEFLLPLMFVGLPLAVLFLSVGAVFCSTATEPRRSRKRFERTSRQIARAFALVAVSVSILNTAFGVMSWTLTIQSDGSAATLGLALGFILAFAALSALAVSLLPCLATLADRIPDRRLARRSRVLTLVLGALLILGVADFGAVLFFDLSVDVDSAGHWVSVVVALVCVVGGGATTVLIWLLIRLYRKAIKQSIAGGVSYEDLFGDVPTEVALPTRENDRPATRSARAETGDTGGESTDADEVPSSGDIPCVHCGYNLRGLPEAGRCPECGTQIAESLGGDLLSAADPAWLQRVYRGQALIYAGCVALLLDTLISNVRGNVGSGPSVSISIDVGTVTLGFVGLLLLGAFATTTLDPRLSLSEQPIVLRRFVRWSIAVLMVLVGCTYFAPQVLRELGAGAELASLGGTVFLCTSGFAFLSWLVGICYYLARLAMRIPDVRLAKHVRSRVVRLVVCSGTVVAFWLVHAQGGWTLPSSKAGMDLYWLKAVMGLVWIIAVALSLVFVWYGVSLMNLMSAYRKAFRKCLLEARKHAAAT